MDTISAKTFPGVYTSVTDQSFTPDVTSRYKPGMIGVAAKGPFNVPTRVRSLQQFTAVFGKQVTGDFFLANAVAITAPLSDGIQVLRVGNQYEDVAAADASGTSGAVALFTPKAELFDPDGRDVYLRVTQRGVTSSVNLRVNSVSTGTITLDASTPLAATYTDGDIAFSEFSGAANEAEGVIYGYEHGAEITAAGDVTGTKNAFTFTIDGDESLISVGDLIQIVQTNRATSNELRVKKVNPAISGSSTIELDTANLSEIGYQAVPLQDNYDTGRIFKVDTKSVAGYVTAATSGDWANGTSISTGLYIEVKPGSKPNTKKFIVYEDAVIIETIDNLNNDPADDDFYETRINGLSAALNYVAVTDTNGDVIIPASTANGWDEDTTNYVNLPFLNINAGLATGSQFTVGSNGLLAQDTDFVGTTDPSDDSQTGIKAFENTDDTPVNVLVAPMNNISVGIMRQLNLTAKKINAIAIADIPRGLNPREAVDWHNGVGLFSSRGGRIDSAYLSVFWNWITITDPFTGTDIVVPPTLGALRAQAFTFDREKPWYAAAGEKQGLIPEAISVQFPRVSEAAREAMYGDGQSVNPILLLRNKIVVYGERTLQLEESKLSQIHSVILVNHIINGLAILGRQFVFDPNDAELLVQINLAFTSFLDKVQNERGIEGYSLVVDDSNNTPTTRNNREVHVNLSIIPTDTAERIFINATVRESGAELTSNS